MFYLKIVFVCVFACGYVYVSKGAQIDQKDGSEPLELELQAVVRQLTWVLATELRSSVRTTHGLSC